MREPLGRLVPVDVIERTQRDGEPRVKVRVLFGVFKGSELDLSAAEILTVSRD